VSHLGAAPPARTTWPVKPLLPEWAGPRQVAAEAPAGRTFMAYRSPRTLRGRLGGRRGEAPGRTSESERAHRGRERSAVRDAGGVMSHRPRKRQKSRETPLAFDNL
jgi:hypothetical protein